MSILEASPKNFALQDLWYHLKIQLKLGIRKKPVEKRVPILEKSKRRKELILDSVCRIFLNIHIYGGTHQFKFPNHRGQIYSLGSGQTLPSALIQGHLIWFNYDDHSQRRWDTSGLSICLTYRKWITPQKSRQTSSVYNQYRSPFCSLILEFGLVFKCHYISRKINNMFQEHSINVILAVSYSWSIPLDGHA